MRVDPALRPAFQSIRNKAIEDCARRVERLAKQYRGTVAASAFFDAVAAIRAMKKTGGSDAV